MTEMFGEAWSPMSVPDLAPDDDDLELDQGRRKLTVISKHKQTSQRHSIKILDLD